MKMFTRPAASRLGVLGSLLGTLALAHGAQAQNAQAEGDPQAGANKTAICAGCHGSDGNSSAPNFPKIAGLGERYVFKQLEDIKTGERVVPEMTGMLEGFSDQDLRDMAAYYSEQTMQISGAQEQQVKINSGAEVPSLDLGRSVYRFGNSETNVPACSGCHAPTGMGNAPAAYPRLGGQFADYIAKQLRDFRAGDRTNDQNQIMRQVAEYMTEAEILAVSNYIAGLYAGERNTAAR